MAEHYLLQWEDKQEGNQGRYAGMTMRGQRDEGLLVISSYRVWQKKGSTTGPHTAYMYQIHAMIKKGDTSLGPRKNIFEDLEKLINKKENRDSNQ